MQNCNVDRLDQRLLALVLVEPNAFALADVGEPVLRQMKEGRYIRPAIDDYGERYWLYRLEPHLRVLVDRTEEGLELWVQMDPSDGGSARFSWMANTSGASSLVCHSSVAVGGCSGT